jgi:hypothetical protein
MSYAGPNLLRALHYGQHNNMMRRVIVSASAVLLVLIGAVAVAMWANDVRQDRQHTVTVDEPTALFEGAGTGCETRQQIAVVQRGAAFLVRRIRYWKDCATLDVSAPDGRLSHFVLGVGGVKVKPPLR